MKKIALFSFVLLFTAITSKAQYTMLFDFQSGSDVVYNFDTKSQTMYYVLAYDAQTAHFYNQDFSFYKSVTAPTIDGYEIYMGHAFRNVSTDVFNADTLIEFSFKYIAGGISSVFIFNENLLEIAVFDSAHIQDIYQARNGEIRMELLKYDWPNIVSNTQTYLLQESPNAVNQQTSPKKSQPAYPNPSISAINLPYTLMPGETAEMKIYDMKGNLLKTLIIGSHFNKVKLNTSSFKPGMYIYRYNKKSGKFIVN